jgi:hypothetical protein
LESSQIASVSPAAFEIAGFFSGTTEETTTWRTLRCFKKRKNRVLESLLVAIRMGVEIRLVDAKANFVYELLISTRR